MASDAAALVPLSRVGADAVFTKLSGHASVTQTLPYGLFGTLSAAGQTSFGRPLLTPEQFDISGAQQLSGYSTGTLAGDSAWVVRQEFGRAFAAQNASLVVTPYLFGATGERVLEEPTALETGVLRASNLGGGARFTLASDAVAPGDFSGFIEGSRQFSDDPTQNGWRLFVGGVWRY
jgi:hemolysin activation/secretion protein